MFGVSSLPEETRPDEPPFHYNCGMTTHTSNIADIAITLKTLPYIFIKKKF